jgi:pilus assembly protein CpaE
MIIACVSSEENICCRQLKEHFVDVQHLRSLQDFINFYAASYKRDIALIYRVTSVEEIEALTTVPFRNNIYMIVIGPENMEFSLTAGKLGVDRYLSESEILPDTIKPLLIQSQTIIKTRRGKSNISVFTGISGGVGTTTIAMNLANVIAANHPEKNVLYLDFAATKAISNLFFNHPKPTKCIVDIAAVTHLELDELFANGLVKRGNNFFFIPGIQRHTQRELLEKPENIQRFLNFINYAKEYFDIIMIDVGIFEDVELEIDLQEIADQIFVVTELNIPSMAILKTYLDIIDKSGWYGKTNILINRADSYGTVSEADAEAILSGGLKHHFKIAYSFPNDSVALRESWNEAKLVSELHPHAKFVKKLEGFIERFFIHDAILSDRPKTAKPSLMAKVRKWL